MRGEKKGVMFQKLVQFTNRILLFFKSDLKNALCFFCCSLFKSGLKTGKTAGGEEDEEAGKIYVGKERRRRVKGRGSHVCKKKKNTMRFSNQIWKVHVSNPI